MDGPQGEYTEHGGTWRPFWMVAAAVTVFVVLELLLPGQDLPWFGWPALVVVLAIVAMGCVSARRVWTVRADDAALTVGRERVPLAQIDAEHLRAVDSGVDAGAPVLGGGWSLPRGRTGLPLRLTDGRTVLVPTRDPAALHEALVTRVSDTTGGHPGPEGTLGR
ncbi:hypothetical protein [Blastococcus haudaquaticus]|uniref:Uncharacterized protein n=1 Tax=Blastococcus haudaquaticus TaxID=1938745 RepID=A0A286GFH9_9ACTN|nr:hypothetical protein [Blastococcus haudaquaticus]SOD94281.1 hypothetical protein SAMN06272739_0679 [Blastococcus haudaquaticus]